MLLILLSSTVKHYIFVYLRNVCLLICINNIIFIILSIQLICVNKKSIKNNYYKILKTQNMNILDVN